MRCLSYAGALSVIYENGVRFASVSACSAGSLVGALLCAGLSTETLVEEIVSKIEFKQLEGKRRYRWKWLELLAFRKYPFNRFERVNISGLFTDVLKRNKEEVEYTDPTFTQLQIPFATAGMDIASKRFLVYSKHSTPDMKVSDALKIALAVPFMTPPQGRPRRTVVDAAVASECPVWMVADYDKTSLADEIPIVALKPQKSKIYSKPANVGKFVGDLIEAGVVSRDYYLISQLPRVRMIEINCGDIAFDNFHLNDYEKDSLIESGRDAALEAMELYGKDFRRTPLKKIHEPKSKKPEDRAEFEAEKLMMNFNRKLPSLARNSVFISYAREDKEWMEKFKKHLQPFVDSGSFSVWSDIYINPGDDWDDKIKQALDSTRVALLLVTAEFLDSAYIKNEELKYFLKASQDNGLVIFWVPVKNASYKKAPFSHIQSAFENPEKALDDYQSNEIDDEIVKICEKIEIAFKPSIEQKKINS
jgi:predicted acylesterase/phospholipase RssA